MLYMLYMQYILLAGGKHLGAAAITLAASSGSRFRVWVSLLLGHRMVGYTGEGPDVPSAEPAATWGRS